MDKYGIPGHNGLDIADDEGTPVYSVADGSVEWVDEDFNYGYYVRVYHPELGLHSFYAHLQELPNLSSGDKIAQGTIVGGMGSTGDSTASHLHFELRAGSQYSYKDVTAGHSKGRFNPEVAYYLYNGENFRG
jgi:murein DD-endopeptidase MepM/ murein hydrolase activator NlpD